MISIHTIKPIHARVNNVFCIKLKSSPQTGYMWFPHDDRYFIKEQQNMENNHLNQYFYYRFTEACEIQLTFDYKRSWETIVLKKSTVKVKIT